MAEGERTDKEVLEHMRGIIRSVRAGHMTPRQADEMCLGEGFPLRHNGWQERHDITTNSVWWLPQAVLFYAWRDLVHTREQWERFQAWEGDLWHDPADGRQFMTLDEAESMLRSDLSAGIVRAFGTDAVGKVRPIPCEAWDELQINRGQRLYVMGSDGQLRFDTAFVLRHEVVPLLISEHAGISSALDAEPEMRGRPDEVMPKRGGGRVLSEHWHDMWAEVCRIIHEEGVPTDRLALVKRMQQWFVDHGIDAPASQKLNPVLDRLFKALGR